jgi:two-component system, cell cycle sensor histidine kinase and response regulator CckA
MQKESSPRRMEQAMARTENGKTILLAEDEEDVRTLVLNILKNSGYHVVMGVNGQNALDKSRQFKGTIDLLLSDVQMPQMTGTELAKQIEIERPGIQILLMSGMGEGLLLNEGWQFLPKPFICNLLKEKIQHLFQPHQQDVNAAKAEI